MINIVFLVSLMGACSAVPSNQYFSSAKLHPNCLRLEPTQSLSVEWGMQLFAGAHFYIPFGSSQAVQQISNLISGKSAEAVVNEDSTKLCALVRIKGFKLQMEGHGEHFIIQDCAVVKKGVNHCTVNQRSENPDAQQQGDGIFTIVWTDNQNSMAVARCTSNGLFNDWYVFSMQPSLNETVKSDVLAVMNKLGFPDTMEKTVSPSYEGCQLFDPNDED